MGEHVHDETGTGEDHLYHWGADRMRRHLREAHNLWPLPMSWDLGRLHQAHLKAHVHANLVQPDEECGAYYGVGDGTAAICKRPPDHPEVSEDGIGHSPQPIPIQIKAEEAPMTQTPNQPVPGVQAPSPAAVERTHAALVQMTTEAALNDKARALWATETGRPEESWPSTTRDTKEHFRRKVRQQEIGYGAASAEHQQREGQRQIQLDRFIAAMAGLDFEEQWAADSGIGSAARGLVREQFQQAAARLLFQLERGGLMPFGPLTEAEQEALTRLKYEKAQALGRASEAEARVRELLAEAAGQMRALQDMAQQLAQEQALVEDMEGTNNQLRAQLTSLTAERDQLDTQLALLSGDLEAITEARDEAVEERDRARQALMAKLAEAGTLREERDQARHDCETAESIRHELEEVNESFRSRAVSLEARLAERTAVLDAGRTKLRELIAELNRDGWDQSTVYRRLVEIVGESVSTAAPIGIRVSIGDVPVTPTQPTAREQIEAWRPADQQGTPWPEGREDEDDLTWARRFAQGGEA